jgi:hypothetical protein
MHQGKNPRYIRPVTIVARFAPVPGFTGTRRARFRAGLDNVAECRLFANYLAIAVDKPMVCLFELFGSDLFVR